MEEGLRTLQRLRADVAGFAGGGICLTEKKSQIPGFKETEERFVHGLRFFKISRTMVRESYTVL